MRKLNIIIFSSGVSESSGTLNTIIDKLENKGYNCFCWRDLFKDANNTDEIALLPILIKKIPTFDFAILICEGHDTTTIFRNNQYLSFKTMRDNVLFEIGLCVMALGLPRVILLTDSLVHLPDDLTGINGKLAIKNIIFNSDDLNDAVEDIDEHIKENKTNYNYDEAVDVVDKYIKNEQKHISPVVIGAATSIAIGYTNNFIIRLLESIKNGFVTDNTLFKFAIKDTFLHIIIPEYYDSNTAIKAKKIQEKLKSGTIITARHRELNFNYEIKGQNLHIYDYPTSLVTSYSTAKMILNIAADDDIDNKAEERFNAKELDLFEATLKSILNHEYIKEVIELYYKGISKQEQEELLKDIYYIIDHNLFIEKKNY